MSKNIRTLYLYIVSFVTLCMMVGAFVGIVNTTVSYFAPNVNYYGSIYPMDYKSSTISAEDAKIINVTDKLDIEKGVANYKAALAEETEEQKLRNLKGIYNSIAVLVVASPLFAYHWSRIEKERKEEGAV